MDWGTLVTRLRASKSPPDRGGWSIFTCTSWTGLTVANPAGTQVRGSGADTWFGWPTDPKIEELLRLVRRAWHRFPEEVYEQADQLCVQDRHSSR